MKKAAIITAMALFSVMVASCDLFPDFALKEPNDLGLLPEGSFYAQNIVSKSFYEVKAERLHEGEKCVIWAEINSGVTKEKAEDIAYEYDTIIRPMIIEKFGCEFNDGSDILDYANELADRNDGKLTILLLNIKDEYKKPADSYVAGYFYPGDFMPRGKFQNGYYSNGRDMIYVDTNPGLKDYATQAYATFAHELQHLVNFVTTVQLRSALMDTWIDEGLSSQAEHFYLGKHPVDKCAWLIDKRNTINTGNNFYVWGNHSDKKNAILDDYATVYLFFRWLYLQANTVTGLQSSIFREIACSPHNDHRAVTDVAKRINPATWNNWEGLLRTWLAAYYYPENSYGYTGDTELLAILKSEKINKIYPNAGKTASLYPGEGVYSISNGSTPGQAGNIRYAQLTGDTQNCLLTFNANTYNAYKTPNKPNAAPETGSVASSVTVSRTAADNSQAGEWAGPYVIDAQDLLGRNRDLPIRQLSR